MSLTFKDVKAGTWERCLVQVGLLIGAAFATHVEVRPVLKGSSSHAFDAIVHGTASQAPLARSLAILTEALRRRHGEPAVLLIDEYDLPFHAAYTHGYYEQAIEFFRNFLSGGLKDNPHLFKGVLTACCGWPRRASSRG